MGLKRVKGGCLILEWTWMKNLSPPVVFAFLDHSEVYSFPPVYTRCQRSIGSVAFLNHVKAGLAKEPWLPGGVSYGIVENGVVRHIPKHPLKIFHDAENYESSTILAPRMKSSRVSAADAMASSAYDLLKLDQTETRLNGVIFKNSIILIHSCIHSFIHS